MRTSRLEAFSDGVIAILITIMVLDLHVPDKANWQALKDELPVLLAYVLSFIYLGIYWNNHHHMLSVVDRVSGAALWANLHLLFWLSLVPFVTGWMSETHFAPVPCTAYGVVLLAAGFAYFILQSILLHLAGRDSLLAAALGRDPKGKSSPVLYCVGIGLGLVNRWLGIAVYIVVALIWLVPDRRVERVVRNAHGTEESEGR